jgi:type II secretory pathway pseudopilin PulG
MGLLKTRLKASSLVETLVATVIIVVIFAVASLTLNAVFKNTIKNNTQEINTELNFLQYQYQTKQLSIPYIDTIKEWEVSIEKTQEQNENYISFVATNKKTQKTVTKKLLDVVE